MTRTMYDIAVPHTSGNFPNADIAAGYIGGDTPHVWTIQEWDAQPTRWRLPIWVRNNPLQHNVGIDAQECINKLGELKVPRGSTVALDAETTVSQQWYQSFDHLLNQAGYPVMLYGSLSTVMQNPKPSAGFWTANWNGVPHIDAGANATQFQNGEYDHSEVNDSLVLWDTKPVIVEDDLPYTPQEIEDMVSNAVKSQPVRDTIAYAGLWWLDKVVNDTVPAAASDAEKAICASVRSGLVKLIKTADTV